ncbi:Phosphoribosylglycinamide formyltransferase [bioreactor metagenome]|jgi:phosphoribosylglycinamide formyltransferase-1|uniref:phosphoribosylglycinamide formyltransferase 1 n=1 Tax=bioreactor metagenome TaxID=1076179 RepID=A0A644V4Q9_9ZZZZ|nr:phosphoribosylglycinamide formyltransferase [Paludibacter sp.]
MTPKIALFASGSGSNVENIVRYFAGKKTVEFPLILSNKQDAFVHERAKMLGVPSVTFSRDEFADGRKIVSLLDKYEVDFIVLAGFLLKVSLPILEAYPNKIINIHPALLPKFGGKGMYGHHVHQAVVDAGETHSGITIHYVNEQYDEGSIIFQATCEVSVGDTPDMVADKVHALEYRYFPEVIEKLAIGVL